jgi:hypothetical protein
MVYVITACGALCIMEYKWGQMSAAVNQGTTTGLSPCWKLPVMSKLVTNVSGDTNLLLWLLSVWFQVATKLSLDYVCG